MDEGASDIAGRNRGVRGMKKFDEFFEEQLQDEEFKKEYEAIEPELEEIRVMVDNENCQNPQC